MKSLGRLSQRALDQIAFEPVSGCWLWMGNTFGRGYARIGEIPGHRVIYLKLVGPIPAGMFLDHLCRTKSCVNPQHMEAVSASENTRRYWGLKEGYCLHGHALDERNAAPRPTGKTPACRACNVVRATAYRQRVAARRVNGHKESPRPVQG